jgi:hypothetical protein
MKLLTAGICENVDDDDVEEVHDNNDQDNDKEDDFGLVYFL